MNKKSPCSPLTHFSFFFLLCLLTFFFSNCDADENLELTDRSHYVLVSVAPHKFFVEKIAGSTLTVGLMVPAGTSAHTFEPTPKQMLAASKADIWFQLGESFELQATKALKTHNPRMLFVDLRQGLDLIGTNGDHAYGSCHCCHANGMDLHIWLSPLMAKTQATTIAKALINSYPENRDLYEQNLKNFINELDDLNLEIKNILDPLTRRVIMVSHPAYAYFCREYHLRQLSVEFEGKDPTPKQLTKTLQDARKYDIKTIYIQMQYNNKGAKLIAKELGARIIVLDPYSERYLESMREIAHRFADADADR